MRFGLRGRLLLSITGVMVVPIVCAAAYAWASVRAYRFDAALRQGAHDGEAMIALQLGAFTLGNADLLRFATDPVVRKAANSAFAQDRLAALGRGCNRFLLAGNRGFHAVVVYSLNGREILRQELVPGSGAQRKQEPDLDPGDPLLSETMQLSSNQREDAPVYYAPVLWDEHGPMLRLATLVRDDNGVNQGLLVLEQRLDRAIERLVPHDEGAALWVMDLSGRFLVHPTRGPDIAGPIEDLAGTVPSLVGILRSERGAQLATWNDEQHLVVHQRLRPPGLADPEWVVAWVTPTRRIGAAEVRLALLISAVGGMSLIAGLLVAWWAASRFARPIRALTEAARQLRRGNYAVSVPLAGRDEVGDLAIGFAAMREAVHQAQEELRHQLDESVSAQVRLVEQDRFLRSLVEQAPLAIAVRDPEGRTVLSNPSWRDVAGLWGDGPNDEEVRAAGRPGSVVSERIPADGGRHWTTVSFAVPFEGRTAVCTIAADIGPRLALAQRLANSQRMESIGHLAGGIAHDFNNLLTVIDGHAQMTLRPGEDLGSARRHAERIHAAAAKASEITAKLLAFGRRAGHASGNCDLAQAVPDAVQLVERLLGERHRIETVAGPAGAQVPLSVAQVTQLVMNLAVNARDALADGGEIEVSWDVADSAGTDEPWVHGMLPPSGPCVVLAVSDHGVGIPVEIQERIFDPFFTTKQGDRGTGLGLAVVFGLVRDAGGAISLRSGPGRGSRFAVWLPAVAAVRAKAALPAAPSARRLRIAVVEDDAQVRELVACLLTDEGHDVTGFVDGAEAAGALERDLPDVLLTDVVMPHLSGPDLARRLRALRADLPLVLMTGWSAGHDIEHSALAGAEVLLKPFSMNDLLAAVAKVSGRGR